MAYHVVTIEFFPVQYIPANKILNLYTNINFTIVYESNSESVLRPQNQSAYSTNLSKEIIQKMVVNPSDINIVTGGVLHATSSNNSASQNKKGMAVMGMSPTSLTNVPDYIIITRSDLASSFQKLANWKTQKGINTIILEIPSSVLEFYPLFCNVYESYVRFIINNVSFCLPKHQILENLRLLEIAVLNV
jgi:hypothetical protein